VPLAVLTIVALLFQVPAVHDYRQISTHDVGRYEGLYGIPIDWSLSLLVAPAGAEMPPSNKAIRTRGVLYATALSKGQADVKLCVENTDQCLALASPVPEIRDAFFFDAPTRAGHEAQVVGAFAEGGFLFWSIDSAPRRERLAGSVAQRSLEQVMVRPGNSTGRVVTVRGRFRGANLFGDLAPETRRRDGDWVLRDGPYSVWITGRPPQGKGWRLSPASRADCVFWVEVEGKVERRGEALYLKAHRVRLQGREPDASCAEEATAP
jgi:hypothetical protein